VCNAESHLQLMQTETFFSGRMIRTTTTIIIALIIGIFLFCLYAFLSGIPADVILFRENHYAQNSADLGYSAPVKPNAFLF
jgi:hypothetical protein